MQGNEVLKAAPPKILKSVLYMSNVDKSADIDSIADFIRHKLDVNVISIFDAKPPNSNLDSVAFRICVPESDAYKFWDTSCLPAGIVIREWFFKNGSNPSASCSPTRPRDVSRRDSTSDTQLNANDSDFPQLHTSSCPSLPRNSSGGGDMHPSMRTATSTPEAHAPATASDLSARPEPATTIDNATAGVISGSGGGAQTAAGAMDTGDQSIDVAKAN